MLDMNLITMPIVAAFESPEAVTLAVLATVLGGMLAWKSLTSKSEGREIVGQPIKTQEVEDSATITDLQKMEERVDKHISELRSGQKDMATLLDLRGMESRVDMKLAEVRSGQERERTVMREETGKLHKRIDDVVEHLSRNEGITSGIRDNVERLLTLAMGKKTS